jgi:GWxTD domain-containing protein
MKRFFQLIVILLFVKTTLASDVQGYFNYNVFNTPNNQPYIETYLTINGNTIVYKKLENGKYQGTLEISISLFRKDSFFSNKKYNLLSQELKDTTIRSNFIDQQRLPISEGVYALEISITDLNSLTKKKFTITERTEVSFPNNQVNISDIELIESFKKTGTPTILTKSGYDLVPYSVNSYDDEMKRLSFYCEAYNTEKILGKNKRIAFFYYLENRNTLEKIEGYAGFSKQKANQVNVLLAQMDIQKVGKGNYNLVVEVKDTIGKLLCQKKIPIQRKSTVKKSEFEDLSRIIADSTFISDVTNQDSLVDYLRSVWPISSTSQRDYAANQIKQKDIKLMQKYFFAFWESKNSIDSEGEWKKYLKQVNIVNTIFSAGKIKGYATDRGRVYLQYGTPDSRQSVNSEPDTYPYEIWQYYKIIDSNTGIMQTNKRFVFCDNELAGNNYKLIHSEARGEINDIRWRFKLTKRTSQNANLDEVKPANTYGNAIDENFIVPK